MQLTQLAGENEDLKVMLSDLRSELEALKANKMENMEYSVSSPARMGLGAVLERLDFSQDRSKCNLSSDTSYDLEEILQNNQHVRTDLFQVVF